MNKPPEGWPFTGRFYPDGAELKTVCHHEKWIDLCWYNPKRDILIYLSTIPFTTNNLGL